MSKVENIEMPLTIRQLSERTGTPYRKLKRYLLSVNKAYHGKILYKVGNGRTSRWVIKLSTIKQFFPDMVIKTVTQEDFGKLKASYEAMNRNMKTLSDKQVELSLKVEYLNQQLSILSQFKPINYITK